jgi:hypothetical protein
MPYKKKEGPQIGDRVRHLGGRIGTVTYIDIRGRNMGRDIVAVRFDDGGVPTGMLPAARYTLISRGPIPFSR